MEFLSTECGWAKFWNSGLVGGRTGQFGRSSGRWQQGDLRADATLVTLLQHGDSGRDRLAHEAGALHLFFFFFLFGILHNLGEGS